MSAPAPARAVTANATAPSRAAVVLQVAAWSLVVLSIVSWRRDVLFGGTVDAVVLGKGAVAVLALVVAVVARRLTGRAPGAGASAVPVVLVGLIVVVSLIGAATGGGLAPALVLAARLVLLAGTIVLLLRSAAPADALRTMLGVLAGFGALAALTGVVSLAWEPGRIRLQGGFPTLEPNELAGLLLPTALWLVALLLRDGLRALRAVALVMTLGAIAWTNSRTTMVLLVLGAVVLLIARRRSIRIPRPVAIGIAVGVLLLLVGLGASGLLADAFLRDQGVGRLLTLNSRTIAWREVFATPPGSPAWWVGRGLDVKDTVVHGQTWQRQVFDSSWVSALAQTGVVGLTLTLVYAGGVLVGTARVLRREPLWFVLALVVVLRGVFENGLIESSTTFLLFFTLACVWWPRRRSGAPLEP